MSGGCFSVLVTPNLSLRTFLLLPYMLGLDFIFFPDSMFLLFFLYLFLNIKKKNGGKVAGCSLQVFQISHVFLSDISIDCALVEYDYI